MHGMSTLPPNLSYQLLQALYFNILDLLLTSSIFVHGVGVHITCLAIFFTAHYEQSCSFGPVYKERGLP